MRNGTNRNFPFPPRTTVPFAKLPVPASEQTPGPTRYTPPPGPDLVFWTGPLHRSLHPLRNESGERPDVHIDAGAIEHYQVGIAVLNAGPLETPAEPTIAFLKPFTEFSNRVQTRDGAWQGPTSARRQWHARKAPAYEARQFSRRPRSCGASLASFPWRGRSVVRPGHALRSDCVPVRPRPQER
jgi:hypothetical protein